MIALVLLAACASPRGEEESSTQEELGGGGSVLAPGDAPALPLRVDGRFIVDARARRFKIVATSWYGAESPDLVASGLDAAKLADIVARIQAMGFDTVRLPWSNELVRKWRKHPELRLAKTPSPPLDPDWQVVADVSLVAQNPGLAALHPMQIFDAVVDALTSAGLFVILDNHVSRADWCCSEEDGNGLWYRDDPIPVHAYSEDDWLEDWRFMARRYRGNPRVIGAELRNELRPAYGVSPTWGDGDPKTDWHRAAKLGGEAVLAIAPHWLVFVGGLMWSQHFEGVHERPLDLDNLVYAPHDYAFFHESDGVKDAASYREAIQQRWGFLHKKHPLWVSEFGIADPKVPWFGWAIAELGRRDVDLGYWALNGTQSSERPITRRTSGRPRTRGAPEGYGLLAPDWSVPTKGNKKTVLDDVMSIRAATHGPK